MKILIMGAGGGIGRHLVQDALRRGHAVRVFMRPERDVVLPAEVRVVRGQLDDAQALGQALDGAEAVLSSVGMQRRHPKNPWSRSISRPDLASWAMEHITSAMIAHGVRRLIQVSAAGVGDSAPGLNLVMRCMLATTMIGTAYRDLAAAEAVAARSGVDWLCPRPVRLIEGEGQEAHVVKRFRTRDAITRRAVATWMLDALEVTSWPHPSWGSRTPQLASRRLDAPEG